MARKTSAKQQGKRDKNGQFRGPPRKEVDWEQFEKLCQIQCTQEEIAGMFDMCVDTLVARVKERYVGIRENSETGEQEEVHLTYSEVYKRLRASGLTSLRRAQMNQAINKNNVTMQIWLGQQYLGQSNRTHSTGGEDNDKNEVEYDIHERLYDEEKE